MLAEGPGVDGASQAHNGSPFPLFVAFRAPRVRPLNEASELVAREGFEYRLDCSYAEALARDGPDQMKTMRMRKHLSLWLIGGAVALVPTLAHAEDEPKGYPECIKAPTESETAAAKGAYQAGNASFDEADYPRAITYWEDAYRRDCTRICC